MPHPEHQPEHEPQHDQPAADLPETGVGAVDEVLAGLRGLEDEPVSEHVAVFEETHRQLRRVLDGSPDSRPDTGNGG